MNINNHHPPLTLGSLFAGIGAFEFAALNAGIKPVWSNDFDHHCCKLLAHRFTHRIIHCDIRQITALDPQNHDQIVSHPNNIRERPGRGVSNPNGKISQRDNRPQSRNTNEQSHGEQQTIPFAIDTNIDHAERTIRPGSRETPTVKRPKNQKQDKTQQPRPRGTIGVEHVDILTGGFPCQPFSIAGNRRGEDDNRFVWDEMLRVVREISPTWVVVENVSGLMSMGNGETLERILRDLECQGYTVQPIVFPCSAVGAWHRRDRVFIIATTLPNIDFRQTRPNSKHHGPPPTANRGGNGTDRKRTSERSNSTLKPPRVRQPGQPHPIQKSPPNSRQEREPSLHRGNGNMERDTLDSSGRDQSPNLTHRHDEERVHTNSRKTRPSQSRKPRTSETENRQRRTLPSISTPQQNDHNPEQTWSPQSGFRGVPHGIPGWVDEHPEPLVRSRRNPGRASAKHRIQQLGNAIVPEVAFHILNTIKQYHNEYINHHSNH